MRPVLRELTADLPATFADLPVPLAVGVIDSEGAPHLLTEGPLPQSVAASCAIPHLFAPVWIGGEPWADGGVADRSAFSAWRQRRPTQLVVMHWVESARPVEPEHDAHLLVVRTPAAGASFLRLGNVHHRFERARTHALHQLEALKRA